MGHNITIKHLLCTDGTRVSTLTYATFCIAREPRGPRFGAPGFHCLLKEQENNVTYQTQGSGSDSQDKKIVLYSL